MPKDNNDIDPEINAISKVYGALKELDAASQARVLNYVAQKLNVVSPAQENDQTHFARTDDESNTTKRDEDTVKPKGSNNDELEGISPLAQKWMTRSGLKASEISRIFSLGVDEIDLIAKTVPGASKKERMHSVMLLKGVAAYLGTGVSRFTHEQLKEASLHYEAYDVNNFASYFKTMTSDISGNKDSGYALTARGLSSATEMVKEMVKAPKGA